MEVEVIGLPGDPKKKYRTKWSTTPNAINPVWNEEPFVFEKVCADRSDLAGDAAAVSSTLTQQPPPSMVTHGLSLCLSRRIDPAARNGISQDCGARREWQVLGTQDHPNRCHPVRSVKLREQTKNTNANMRLSKRNVLSECQSTQHLAAQMRCVLRTVFLPGNMTTCCGQMRYCSYQMGGDTMTLLLYGPINALGGQLH